MFFVLCVRVCVCVSTPHLEMQHKCVYGTQILGTRYSYYTYIVCTHISIITNGECDFLLLVLRTGVRIACTGRYSTHVVRRIYDLAPFNQALVCMNLHNLFNILHNKKRMYLYVLDI